MTRPLRIQYPGAWYHIMNRGRRSEKIFCNKDDYEIFLEVLKESAEMWSVRVAAYCLMPNHYHILLQTPAGNISRAMRHINGVYTQRYNKKNFCDGQLFRGRYKSILVEEDNYLLQLVRYIHRNPVTAGIASKPNDYLWSSERGYLSIGKKWNWLHKEFIFSLLTKDKRQWVRQYKKFVSVDNDEKMAGLLERERWPLVLGSEKFIDWVKGRYYTSTFNLEVPQTKELAPSGVLIINTVCGFYNISTDQLYVSRRGEFNEPRNVAIFLMRKLRCDSLNEIGRQFQMDKYSSVSSILVRMKKLTLKDRGIRDGWIRLLKPCTRAKGRLDPHSCLVLFLS